MHEEEEELQEIYSSLAKAKQNAQRVKRQLNSLATVHYHMTTRNDTLTNNLKEVTQKLTKIARIVPQAINMVLEDTQNPRDDEGNLVWRHAKSNKERLLGSQQQHTDWTGTAEEKKAIHYYENKKDKEDKEDRTDRALVNSTLSPPNNKDITYLLPDGRSRITPEDTRKLKEMHNPKMAKVFGIPDKVNPHFIYPCFSTQKDKTIEFDKVREEFYKIAASIPGKARYKGFTLSVIGRAPME